MMTRGLISTLVLLMCLSAGFAQTQLRRSRGEGFYRCQTANTVGSGNIWLTGQALGYIWDAKDNQPMPQGYLQAWADVGIFDVASLNVQAQFLTFIYGRTPTPVSRLRAMLKATPPNNRDLRLFGYGVHAGFEYSLVEDFVSLGGYRVGGTGWSPDGIKVEGGTIVAEAIADMDLITKISFLPLKIIVNNGIRIPLEEKYRMLSQYTLEAGIAYCGLSFDAFLEWSYWGLFNSGMEPKKFPGEEFYGSGRSGQVWEIAWSENPMYLTLGGRFRYENGMQLYCAVPLLLSMNQGSTMEDKGTAFRNKFPEEVARGINQGFDPWFAKWKLVLRIGFPIRYRQTGSEMRRNFLLLKNKKGGTKIDIDERLKVFEDDKGSSKQEIAPVQKEKSREEDKEDRLKKIRERREKMQDSN